MLQAPILTGFQMLPESDTGIPGDQNTNLAQPRFVGQVYNSFPGTVANLNVYVQFNSLHGGSFTLGLGSGGRGVNNPGLADIPGFTTDANGRFEFTAPTLPEGFSSVKIVVVGQPDLANNPNGLASETIRSFRVDLTPPHVTGASLTPGGAALPLPAPGVAPIPVQQLTSLSLSVIDYSNPSSSALATPSQVLFDAIDPSTAANVSNYSLILDRGKPTERDLSSFITRAVFTRIAPVYDNPANPTTIVAYQGRIDLTIASNLPAGVYTFIARANEGGFPGLRDAAGNSIDQDPSVEGSQSFLLEFNIQSTPVFIRDVGMITSNPDGSTTVSGPRSYFELPSTDPNYVARATAPPRAWTIELSNPLPVGDYSGKVQLIRSANPGTEVSDGDFGTLGQSDLGSSGTGFTVFSNSSNSTVTLQYRDASGNWQTADANNPGTRLVLSLNQGVDLPADRYRLYLPNQIDRNGNDTRILDIFGNLLDGEFLGNPTSSNAFETLLPTGAYRAGLSGDTVAGGAFMTGFTVVPAGNIIFARPDYQEDPLQSSTAPDGSLAKPYSALAPESPAPGPDNPTHDPNGGRNSSQFFLSGFNAAYDRNGNRRFDRSALYAASQLAYRGPVVVVALPGTPQRDPISGVVSQQTFVLQAPAGSNPVINDASASVPFDTTLVFAAGSTLKLQNASLYAQNQGSSILALGQATSTGRVTFTSYSDDTIGGDTNRDGSNTTARPGDWGGLAIRNFNQAVNNRSDTFPVDGTLVGVDGGDAISGADDAMTSFNFVNLAYAGGAVPATTGFRYDGFTLSNSRPAITNTSVAFVGGAATAQAGISGDFDSFREDDLARGPLIRRTTVTSSSINGIWVRPELTGQAQQTNAMSYAANPDSMGAARNFVFDDPLPYVLTSRLNIGQGFNYETKSGSAFAPGRLYVQQGMLVKSQRGASVIVSNERSSLNVGDRTYIDEYDLDPDVSPTNPNFRPNTQGDAQALFTSFADDAATTYYFDPVTQQRTTIVPAIDSDNNGTGNQPSPGNVPDLARWGAVMIQPGARAVIDEAQFRYGGGFVNTPSGTIASMNVLSFVGYNPNFNATGGAFASITNNDFFDNQDAPIAIEPNGLLAADPLTPLSSGNPFYRGNVMERNDINGLAVLSSAGYADGGPVELAFDPNADNAVTLSVNSIWDDTDLTYVVRGTIILDGRSAGFGGGSQGERPMPDADVFGPALTPAIVLTIQSNYPDTMLANGVKIARPGESAVVKFLNEPLNNLVRPPGDNVNGSTGANSDVQAGAGFIVGVDDGVDPDTAPLLGSGMDSQIRIVGIGANETTGQQRVPVVFTSLLDGSISRTVRGVDQSATYPRPVPRYLGVLGTRTTPQAGDGGLIYFGGKSLTDYNLFDPRDGNIIDNADIKYLTRVEVQGGGVIDVFNTNPGTDTGQNDTFDRSDTASDNPRGQMLGNGSFTYYNENGFFTADTALNQYNSSRAMAISNSNFANMSSAGVLSHPGPNMLARNVGTTLGSGDTAVLPGDVFRAGFASEPVNLFMYGNTFANMPLGVRMNSETGNNDTQQNAQFLVLMNNTFNNVNVGLHTQAPEFSAGPPPNTFSNVEWLAMNNIFANSSDVAIRFFGQQYNTQAQYNLYWNNARNIDDQEITTAGFGGNNGAVGGDPKFRDPANGDFRLLPSSAAIDASRSELGPVIFGNMLAPISSESFSTNGQGGTRTRTGRLGFSAPIQPTDIVSLPGYAIRPFSDQWVAALPGSDDAFNGTGWNPGSFFYTPMRSERDQNGYQRVDDSSVANVGFGSRPFFDIGAYEYRQLFPPHVTNVTATVTTGGATNTFPFYTPGGIAGASQTPSTINITFDNLLALPSINDQTVLLQASGGDGIFGNGNNASDKFISLAGRLSFDDATRTLRISLGAAGTTLTTDRYRLILRGTGSDVLRDPQGNALDGENTVNNLPDGAQLPLPSGNGFPGGNFYTTFLINADVPTVTPGSFQLASQSDTNISGDGVTTSTLPSFVGAITVTNPTLVPLAGQTAIVDIGVADPATGIVYFADSPNIPASILPYLRQNAGTGVTDANGNFTVTLGIDAANTGLVANTAPLANSPINVGSSGKLVPLPPASGGTTTGYYVARARVVDQSGNQSNSNAAGSRASFVVDTAAPNVSLTNPVADSVIDNATTLSFTVQANENLDMTHFTPTQVQLLKSAPNGSFTGTGVTTIALDPASFVVTYLDQGTGGTGRVQVVFRAASTLANGLYQVTLVGSGADSIRDIAGNSPAGGDVVVQFAVFNPASVNGVFVGASTYITDPTQPQGNRSNPFPTITAAMAAAAVGDRLQVLPGVYTERVTLLPFVSIASADVSSTNGNFVPGNALDTIVRAPAASGSNVTITATNLRSFVNPATGFVFQPSLSGLTVASPLIGDPALGSINDEAIALQINNSSLLVERSYFIDAGMGIYVTTSGADAVAPNIFNNGIIGNTTGLVILDDGSSPASTSTNVINNTFAYNTTGLSAVNTSATGPRQAYVANNIFWQNHSQSAARSGFGIVSSTINKLVLNNNMFSGNGPSDTNTAYAAVNIGNGFDAALLGPSASNASANLGNYTGYPSFVSPRDPRPGSDGPATFLRDANFGLTSTSAAINNALAASATTTDFLGNPASAAPTNRGFGLPGYGPRDVGAFEFIPLGSAAVGAVSKSVGGSFRVVTTSLVPDSGTQANGATLYASPGVDSVIVSFSRPVDKASVQATDLVLSGSIVDSLSSIKSTGLTWLNDHTVRFNLNGKVTGIGTVNVSVASGAVKSLGGQSVAAYADRVVVNTVDAPPTPTPTATPPPPPPAPPHAGPEPGPGPHAGPFAHAGSGPQAGPSPGEARPGHPAPPQAAGPAHRQEARAQARRPARRHPAGDGERLGRQARRRVRAASDPLAVPLPRQARLIQGERRTR
ncbi:MAG: hypothetical protein U0835_23465 [Isosphaeraceae bacterium]